MATTEAAEVKSREDRDPVPKWEEGGLEIQLPTPDGTQLLPTLVRSLRMTLEASLSVDFQRSAFYCLQLIWQPAPNLSPQDLAT